MYSFVFEQVHLLKHAIVLNLFILFLLFLSLLISRNRVKKSFGAWLNHDGHSILSFKKRFSIAGLLVVCFCLLNLILLKPIFVESQMVDKTESVKIAFVLDGSPSMLAEDAEFDVVSFGIERFKELSNRNLRFVEEKDFKINRLSYAKAEIIKTLDYLKRRRLKDEIVLVVFADKAFSLIPYFTSDYNLVFTILSEVDDYFIWHGMVPGSNFGRAVYKGIGLFKEKDQSRQILILLTDGEREEKKLTELDELYRQFLAYYFEKERNYPVYIFGVGDSTKDSPIPLYDERGNWTGEYDVWLDGPKKGKIVMTSPDPLFLKEVQEDLNAEFIMASKGASLKDEILNVLQKERKVIGKEKISNKRSLEKEFSIVVMILFIFILVLI